jgi:type I restriction enzyme M protein
MRIEEFEAEKSWWGYEGDGFISRKEGEHSWKVGIDDLKDRNYNLDIKNPHFGELEIHDSETLLAQYEALQAEIYKLQMELKSELEKALMHGND